MVAKNLADLVARAGYSRIVELDWGESLEHKGVRVTALGVNHWGTRGLLPDRRGYCGFLLESSSGTVFFPGDTAYTPIFRDYGQRFEIDARFGPQSLHPTVGAAVDAYVEDHEVEWEKDVS